jgi:RNA-directed DNA polymerase
MPVTVKKITLGRKEVDNQAPVNQIYEADFKGFSYEFRPGRGPHQGLDALTVGLQRKRVNWVLDADIRGFFDNMSHEWTMKFIEHRAACFA